MHKNKLIEISITIFLVVVLLFAVARAIKRPKKEGQPSLAKQEALQKQTPIAEVKVPPKDLFFKLEEEAKGLALKNDPFSAAPIAALDKKASVDLQLSGIVWDKISPTAIINGRIVDKGDKILGNVVVEIKQDRIILNDGSRNFELKLSR